MFFLEIKNSLINLVIIFCLFSLEHSPLSEKSLDKKETMKKELIKLLEEESNFKKTLINKIDTFSSKGHELKAKLIETKILDLNSKSMIELGKFD